ncbi:MAG: UDP-2,3-diacylglucosamine diphosphatase [Acidiferrobacterales bacterium]
MSTALFISDLHLDKARPAMVRLFLQLLQEPARHSGALYILGDLFDIWIGDDNGKSEYGVVLDALRRCTESGIPIFIMHGNRDFLLGDGFMSHTGCRLLPDPTVIDLEGEPSLLMHGDTLCTGDKDYQEFRFQVRDLEWQRNFLSKSVEERRHIADGLRRTSRAAIQDKPLAIMDVNPDAVEDAFRDHQVHRMIHGHTHRPGIHALTIDEVPAQRIVLGDWYRQGSVLRYESGNFELQTFGEKI